MTRITPFARLMIAVIGLLSSLIFLLISLFGSFVSAQGAVSFLLVDTALAAPPPCSDTFYGGSDCATIISPCPDGKCDSKNSIEKLRDGLDDQIETDKKFTEYIQDVVIYLLGFTALVCVLLIIYHGFRVLVSGGNEETLKKAKSAILYAFIGLTLIFLAYSITIFIVGDDKGNRGILNPLGVHGLVDVAYAADPEIDDVTLGTFGEYRIRLSRVLNRIYEEQNANSGVSSATISELRSIMSESIKTLPDAQTTANGVQVTKLNVAISNMQANPNSRDAAKELEALLRSYRDGARIDTITGDIGASPQSGNAPLTVTLRAENVRDPSGKTIPNANYIWYLKAPKGEKIKIGNGVSINYTFNEEKEYTVFLDVVSASKNTYGKTDVLPLQKSIQISALPKIANMILYVNGVNVSQLDSIKVTPGQARAGLIIDATASRPKEGTRFTQTSWDFGNGRSYTYDGGPRLERQVYAQESDYTVKLRIQNNVGGFSEKTILIQVRDPIASIVTSVLKGYITDDFRFTTNSVNSRLNLQHDWLVIDNRENKEIARGKGATFTYKFKKVGEYTVKLDSVGADGSRDSDSVLVVIEPRAPLVSFQAGAVSSEQPNVIRLDATQSIDPDTNSADKLQYRWKIDGSERELSKVSRNGAIGEYKMTELGEHTIELSVVSPNGLSATTSKKIQISSLLGANLTVAQKIVRIGESMLFIADAPEANIFMWDFGDGKAGGSPSTDRRITHVYDRAGVYTVTLNIRSDNSGASNRIQRVVYVGDAETPVPAITVSQGGEVLAPEIGICGAGQEGYRISRLSSITISGQDSANIDGTNSNLTYSWKVDQKVSSAQTLPFSFDELKCAKVQLSVRSNQNGATATRTVWMDVRNLPPTLSGLNISSVDTTKDPVVVNVEAVNATDPDGVVTSYIWYYWTQTDNEPQEMRVTRTPQTTFVLPGINDKYYFGVILEDSNGAKVKSVDILSQDASMTLTGDDINTPLISLKASATNIAAGKEVTFQASAKDLTDANITDKTNFKWDFDGDGFYDKNGTGSIAKFSYDRPGTYRVKVKALYKGVSNTRTINITVTNELKPSFDYIAIGRMVILVNSTKGVFNQVTWELPDGATSSELDSVTISLPEGMDSAPVTMRVSDGDTDAVSSATVRIDTRNIKTAVNQKGTFFVTVPRIVGDTISIDNPDERVMLYVGSSSRAAKFAIDDNLSVDTNLDGDAANDADNQNAPSYRNGGVYVVKGFSDRQRERKISVKVYDAKDSIIDEKTFTIVSNFVQVVSSETPESDLSTDIREIDRKNLEELKSLIQSKAPESARPTLLALYSKLKDEWFDQNQKIQTIIDFEKAIAENGLDTALTNEMHTLLEGFLATDGAMSAEVSVAVSVVKGIIPTDASYSAEVLGGKGNIGLLNEILAAPNNLTENKDKAKRILELVAADDNITVENKKILKSQLLIILHGGTENIPTDQIEPPSDGGGESTGGFMDSVIMIAKIIGILILGVFGIFFLLFFIFKFTNKNESLGFQDWMIDKLFHHGGDMDPSSSAPAPKPLVPVATSAPTAPVASVSPIDPLASSSSLTSSRAPVDPLSPSSAPSDSLPSWMSSSATTVATPSSPIGDPLAASTPATAMPSWLQPSASSSPSSGAPSDTIDSTDSIAGDTESSSELPAWLKQSSVTGDETVEDHSDLPVNDSSQIEPTSENPVATTSPSMPSWLQPTQDNESPDEATSSTRSGDDITPTSPPNLPSWLQSEASSSSSDTGSSSLETSTSGSGLPSWLESGTSSSDSNLSVEPLSGATMTDDTQATALPSWLSGEGTMATEDLSQAPSTDVMSIETPPVDLPATTPSELPSWLTPAPMAPVVTQEAIVTAPETDVEESTSLSTGAAPRKPRRKSKVQEREESETNPSSSVTPSEPTPDSDLPAWLRP